jgi:hypothetical protein
MTKQLSPTLAQEIVRRIRATAEPEKIILFGSRARGEGCGLTIGLITPRCTSLI